MDIGEIFSLVVVFLILLGGFIWFLESIGLKPIYCMGVLWKYIVSCCKLIREHPYKSLKIGACGAGIIVVILFAIYVWPTRYKYVHLERGMRTELVRIDRFTNEVTIGKIDYYKNTIEYVHPR